MTPVSYLETGVLYCDDNLRRLSQFPSECVDLIYLDPPFFSNRNYEVIWGDEAEVRSFTDRWDAGVDGYINWMHERLIEMHRVLKPTGSLYLHCDWHANHHLRVLLDHVFGANRFQNEFVWYYSGGGASKKRWARKHDTIFLYSKGTKWTFNADAVRTDYKWKEGQRRADGSGRDLKKGKLPDDVWEHHGIMPWAKERVGYPTQKPEALLERLLLASSSRGDIVLDPFCGCGTTVAVAQRLGRHWIGIDISSTAVPIMEERVRKLGALDVKVVGMPVGEDQLRAIGHNAFENWVIQRINGTHAPDRPPRGMGIDGYSFMEHHPVQVKQSDDIGRNVVDNFAAALRRAKRDKGFIIAFSFGKGARAEVARLKREDKLEVHLVKVSALLTATSELSQPGHDEMIRDLMPAARPQSALPSAAELIESASRRI